jgi:hypothetical protein
MTTTITFQSVVPPGPAEASVAAAGWERRGILGRLVRLDFEAGQAEEQRSATPFRLTTAPAVRSL